LGLDVDHHQRGIEQWRVDSVAPGADRKGEEHGGLDGTSGTQVAKH
jgi:hypothetical protein